MNDKCNKEILISISNNLMEIFKDISNPTLNNSNIKCNKIFKIWIFNKIKITIKIINSRIIQIINIPIINTHPICGITNNLIKWIINKIIHLSIIHISNLLTSFINNKIQCLTFKMIIFTNTITRILSLNWMCWINHLCKPIIRT